MILCILFSLFIIKHFICDFWLQTSSMIAEKGTYGAKGGIEHALIHTVATLMILLIFLEPISLALILAAVDGLIHYHIDWAKMKYTRDLTTSDRKFWIWLGADQMLHYLTYILILIIIIEL